MRERKREIQHNLSFTFCAIDILQSFDEKKMKNTHLAILYSILFRLVIVTECIINLERERGRERKGGREGRERRERELDIFLAIKAKLFIQ